MNPDVAIVIAVDATCYRMKFFIDNSDCVMVSGSWHRCVMGPAISKRIIGLVRSSVLAVRTYASHCKNLSCQYADRKRATGRRHRLFCRPAIDGRVVLVNCVDRTTAGDIAADDVEFSVNRRSAGMM